MRQLPVGKAFGHVVNSTLSNLQFAVRSQWPWVLIMGVLLMLMRMNVGDVMSLGEDDLRKAMEADPSLAVRVGGWFLVLILVGLLAFASVAVNWHRYILTDELPKGLQMLRLDGVVWRYLGNLILISLVVMLVAIPVVLVTGILMSVAGPLAIPMFIALAAVTLLPVTYRLSVKLPAVALGRGDFRMGDAWRVTDGNWWQIVGLGLLVTVVTWVAGLVLMGVSLALQGLLPDSIAGFADILVQVGANWVLTILGITTLTSLYGFFVEGRDF